MIFLLILTFLDYSIPNREYKVNLLLEKRWVDFGNDSLSSEFIRELENVNSIDELYLLDSLFLSKVLYSKSDFVESRLINLVRSNEEFIHTSLSDNYSRRGISDLKNNNEERGVRELNFSFELDPSRKSIPIILIKYYFPNWRKVLINLKKYFSTYEFLNNKVSIIINILYFIIIFLGVVYIAIIISGFFKTVPFLSEWVRQRMKISSLWIPAIIFALFVWLPVLMFIVIIAGISIIKLTKRAYIKLAIISFITPFLIAYTNSIKTNFSNNSSVYLSYKARYDPYNFSVDELKFPYAYAVKGIELAESAEFAEAESLFQKGYDNNESLIFMVNLASLNFSKENYGEALDLSKRIVNIDPENPIANLILATIYLDRLDFEEVTMYIERATRSGPEYAERELPIFQYPPDKWLIGKIFKASGMGNFIIGSKLYIFFILGIFFVVLSLIKRLKDDFCPICNRILINRVKIENEKICDVCALQLSMTDSKSIRERLKRYIRRRAYRIKLIKYLIMNLIFPGSAHLYKSKWFLGIILLFLGAIFLFVYAGPFYSEYEVTHQFEMSNLGYIFIYLLVIYYILLIFLTWRLTTDGNRR
jgi:tetratricopeptide (TPR) repeat protein